MTQTFTLGNVSSIVPQNEHTETTVNGCMCICLCECVMHFVLVVVTLCCYCGRGGEVVMSASCDARSGGEVSRDAASSLRSSDALRFSIEVSSDPPVVETSSAQRSRRVEQRGADPMPTRCTPASYWAQVDRFCYTTFLMSAVETGCQMDDSLHRKHGNTVRRRAQESSSFPVADVVICSVGITVGEFALGCRERRDRTQRRVSDTRKSAPTKRARAAMMTELVEVPASTHAGV